MRQGCLHELIVRRRARRQHGQPHSEPGQLARDAVRDWTRARASAKPSTRRAFGGDFARGARLLGFTSSALDAAGNPREYTELTGYERLPALLAQEVPEDERSRLEAEGHAYSLSRARSEAMRRT